MLGSGCSALHGVSLNFFKKKEDGSVFGGVGGVGGGRWARVDARCTL